MKVVARKVMVRQAFRQACYFCEIKGDFKRTLFYFKDRLLECACSKCKKTIVESGGTIYEPYNKA